LTRALLVLLAVLIIAALVLPAVLQRQATAMLEAYGVQNYSYAGLQLFSSRLEVREVTLRGERDGLAFEAGFETVALSWQWPAVLDGRLQSAHLQALKLTLERRHAGSEPTPGVIQLAALLPRSTRALLPLEALRIENLDLEYRDGESKPLRALGSLEIHETARLELSAQHLNTDVRAALTIPATGPELGVEATATGPSGELFSLSADLDASSAGIWQWRGGGTLHLAPLLDVMRAQYPPAPGETFSLEALDLRGTMNLDIGLQHPDHIDKPVSELAGWLRGQQGRVRLHGAVERLDYADDVRELQGNFALGGEFEPGGLSVHLDSADFNASVASEVPHLPAEAIEWLGVDGRLPLRVVMEDLRLQPVDLERWQVELGKGRLALGTLDNMLRFHGLTLRSQVEPATWNVASLSLTSRLDARLQQRSMPSLAISLAHAGSSSHSHYDLAVRDVAESVSVRIAGDVDLATGAGDGALSLTAPDLPAAASTLLPLLARFDVFDEDVEITAGRASLDSRFASQAYRLEGLRQEATLAVQGVSGRYEEYRFANLALDATWQGTERWRTSRPVRFTLGSLDLGFVLSDLEATAQIPRMSLTEPPIVQLETFSSGVFGGRLLLPEPALWDFGADGNRFSLEAQNWQLAQLVALQQGQKIQATGLLEGRLPVEFTGGRLVIEKGDLHSVPPGGSIRYAANESSRALAGSSAEFAMALDLLEDFRFQVLSAEVRLDREGQLWLGLSMAGKNPSRFGGRAVNFNINLEQNLDPLLQSLRLSDKLVEKLERNLK
jgi:hypothetical protein